MKKQYIYPRTSVSALDGAWYLTQSLSSNVELNNSGTSANPGGALAPNRRVF